VTLTPRVGQRLSSADMQALTNCKGLYTAGPSATSTSSTWATFGSTVTFVKVDADSQVLADMYVSGWANTASCFGDIGLRFGSSAYDFPVTYISLGYVSTHRSFSGHQLLGGIPSGSYTVSMLIRRTSGTGTITLDSNDTLSYTIWECRE